MLTPHPLRPGEHFFDFDLREEMTEPTGSRKDWRRGGGFAGFKAKLDYVLEDCSRDARVLMKDWESSVFSLAASRATRAAQKTCLLYTSPSPRDQRGARMPSSA